MIRVGILGGSGRMGRDLKRLLASPGPSLKGLRLVASVGKDSDLRDLLLCDVVIDFSQPVALAEWLRISSKFKRLPALVSGTTGLKAGTLRNLKAYAKKAPVLHATNYSIGIHWMGQVLKEISPRLFMSGFTAAIAEAHHIHKKDKPSGTALTLQNCVSPGKRSRTPIISVRKGEIVGEHTVVFQGPAETLILHHSAQSRSLFSQGALVAAKWIFKKKPGTYALEDCFGKL